MSGPKIGLIMDDVVDATSPSGSAVTTRSAWITNSSRTTFGSEAPFKHLKPMAEAQLGTVGSGNHYVDIFVDDEDRVWVGVHFGSRGLGHKTATQFLKKAGGKDGMDVDPAVVREQDMHRPGLHRRR